MRIGYDAKRLMYNPTGLGNYSRTLLANLINRHPEHHYILYATPSGRPIADLSYLPETQVKVKIHGQRWNSAWWRTFRLASKASRDNIQLFHGLSNELPRGIHRKKMAVIVTIHDIIYRQFPEDYPWLDRQIYHWKTKYACKAADCIVAISHATKEALMEYYEVPEDKIRVIKQTCAQSFKRPVDKQENEAVRDAYSLPDSYLLYVGTINRRKNLLTLVRALERIPSEVRIPLVVVGEGKQYKREVLQYLQEHSLEDEVFFLSRVQQQDLPEIYQMATLFVYPSLYEGFGLPIIEAQYCGVPVITSDRSSLPEAGGEGAKYVDPTDPDELADAIRTLLEDEDQRDALNEKAKIHLRRFDERLIADQWMQLYRSVIGSAFR